MVENQQYIHIKAGLVIFWEYDKLVICLKSAHNNVRLLCAFYVISFLAL